MRHMLALILVSGAAIALDAPAAAAPDRAEITYWESVRDSTTPAELEAYLKAYPSGQFAPLAKLRLKTLQGAEKKSDAATEDGGSGAPATDTAKSRTEETSGTESLTLTAKLAKREINGVPRTVLGVNISDLTKYQASCFRVPEATGVLVQNVVADSPASQAGIVGGDIIREFEGKPVKTARGLMDLVSAQPAGVSAKVGVLRPRALRNGAKAIADRAAAGGGGDMLCFAFLQMNGLGAEKNLAEANRWYRKAAEAGVTDAMYNLANHLENGTGIAKDIAEANRWHRKAAEAGNANAMVSLAMNLLAGNGITKDAAEANRWYRKAAEAGSTAAMTNLAFNLEKGNGIATDAAEANRWYLKAAEGGHANAMNNLAVNLYKGDGIAKNGSEAVRWYRAAADRGLADAMYGLGAAYETGTGVGKDSHQAAQWVFKAVKAGSSGSVGVLRDNSGAFGSEFRREFQRLLREAGHYDGEIDGDLGSGTQRAIAALFATSKKTTSQSAADAQPSAPATSAASPPPDLGNVKDLDTLE